MLWLNKKNSDDDLARFEKAAYSVSQNRVDWSSFINRMADSHPKVAMRMLLLERMTNRTDISEMEIATIISKIEALTETTFKDFEFPVFEDANFDRKNDNPCCDSGQPSPAKYNPKMSGISKASR